MALYLRSKMMRSIKFGFIFSLMAAVLAVSPAFGQDQTFSDPHVDYTFSLPDAKWRMTVKPSATNSNVEYVYGDRNEGHLDVRRITIPADTILTDLIHDDEEQKLMFRPGFVAGRDETFVGRLRGSIYNFEYVAAGRPMAGRFYFLRADPTTVYVLRFSGRKDSMRSIRNQTDSIARTFNIAK